jgi:hypothetical protein
MGVDRKGPVFYDRNVQPDAAHTAMVERSLARKTAAMVYRYAGGRYNHIWPDPSSAPYATLSALATWTKFSVTDGTADGTTDWRAPWFHCNQYDAIKVIMFLGVDQAGVKLLARAYTDDLVDAVAATNGSASECQYRGMQELVGQDTNWRQQIEGIAAKMKYVSATSTIQSPTLPGNRRVAVYPQVYIDNSSSAHIDQSGTIDVWLKQVIIVDVPESEAGV